MVMMKIWFTSVTSKILKLYFADSCHHALHCKEIWPLRKGKLLETHIWTIRAQLESRFWLIFYNYTDGRRTRTSRYAGGAEYGLPVILLFFLLVISEDWQKSHQCNVDRKSGSQERMGSTLLRRCCRRRLWVFKESLLGKVIGMKITHNSRKSRKSKLNHYLTLSY